MPSHTPAMRAEVLKPITEARELILALRESLLGANARFATLQPADPELVALGEIADRFDQVCEALRQPKIALATVGTTSAGKSTLLNALLGCKLAPMDADEMSAGLLRIEHGERWALTSEPPLPGLEALQEPDTIYARLVEEMNAQRARRHRGEREGSVRYTIAGPLLPMQPVHDFYKAFRGSIGLSFFDLPGLRTVDDLANKRVIKGQIDRAFVVVVINLAGLFNKEQREELLQELRETVRELGNQTSTMLFIANQADRIDRESMENSSLEERLEQLRVEIVEKLELEDAAGDVEIIPFCAQNYYHASSLWFACQPGSGVDPQALRAGFDADFKEKYARRGFDKGLAREFDELTRELRYNVEDGEATSPDELARLARLAVDISGHAAFWRALERRVEAHGVQLVVFPLVRGPLSALGQRMAGVRQYIKTMQMSSEEEIARTQAQIDALVTSSTQRLRSHGERLASGMGGFIDAMQDQVGSTSSAEAFAQVHIGDLARLTQLEQLQTLVSDLRAELMEHVLEPLIDALTFETEAAVLTRTLSVHLPQREAAQIAACCEQLAAIGYTPYATKDQSTFKYETGAESDEIRRYRALQDGLAALFLSLRKAITSYSQSYLAREGALLVEDLRGWMEQENVQVWSTIQAEADGLLIAESDPHVWTEQVTSAFEHLPDDLIRIAADLGELEQTEAVVIGQAHERPDASCFKGALRDVKEDRTFTTYHLPGAERIGDQLLAGFDAASWEFWGIFGGWFGETMTALTTQNINHIAEFARLVQRAGEQRIAELQEHGQELQEAWTELDAQYVEVSARASALMERIRGQVVHG